MDAEQEKYLVEYDQLWFQMDSHSDYCERTSKKISTPERKRDLLPHFCFGVGLGYSVPKILFLYISDQIFKKTGMDLIYIFQLAILLLVAQLILQPTNNTNPLFIFSLIYCLLYLFTCIITVKYAKGILRLTEDPSQAKKFNLLEEQHNNYELAINAEISLLWETLVPRIEQLDDINERMEFLEDKIPD